MQWGFTTVQLNNHKIVDVVPTALKLLEFRLCSPATPRFYQSLLYTNYTIRYKSIEYTTETTKKKFRKVRKADREREKKKKVRESMIYPVRHL